MIKKTLKYGVVILIALLIPITTINAKTIAELEKELEAAEKKLNDTNVKKAANKQDINETNKKINTIKANIEKINSDIDAKTKESEQLEKDIVAKNKETEDMMRYYQITSSGSTMLEYIMGAESITDLVYRLAITEQITNYNKKVVKEMNDMINQNEVIKKDLEQKKIELSSLKSELDTQLTILLKKSSELDKDGISEENSIKEIKKNIKSYVDMGCDRNESIDACYARKFGSGYLPSGTTFYRPTTSGRITSEFGLRDLLGSPNNHYAIDIGMATGTPVYSVSDGIVAYTGNYCGNAIVIWHNVNGKTYSSLYCHLSTINVKKNQIVTKNTVIAKSGCTGQCYGAHLHLGLATGKFMQDYTSYYRTYDKNGKELPSFAKYTFNPRNVITFPAKGSSYYNR